MTNNQDKFVRHDIEWTPLASYRIWEFYSSSVAHRKKYFGNRCGIQVARLLSHKLFHKVTSILDYSCGRGDILEACIPFLKSHHKIYACDISEKGIEITTDRLKNTPNFSGATAIKTFPSHFPNQAFDLVIATEIIEHLNSTELHQVLSDLARITAKGRYVFITTPYEEDLHSEETMCPECGCVFHRWQHQRSWSPDELVSILSSYGFTTLECKNLQWGAWPIRLYYRLARLTGNGIYYIGRKV
jgi:2-polyprenyl-3-methyl-5-hydroxy-6-metoxy-1,4-benzoquinol methylase